VHLIACVAITAAFSWATVGLYLHIMRAQGRVEAANPRSMHSQAVPVGAGIVVIPIALSAWAVAQPALSAIDVALLIACAGLALVSWLDDLVRIAPIPRLVVHTLAVAWCVLQLASDLRAMPWLPLLAERAIEALAWIWFINLFNFMDGIDGLAGSEAIALALGYVAMAMLAGVNSPLTPLAVVFTAAMLGYLLWNWHPARVLMGDAGSIPLGFVTGWLMLDLALRGMAAAAIILPMFFWADATSTLLRRLWQGQLPHQPHRDHYYQRATLGRRDHRAVVMRVIGFNLLLLALALLSAANPALALVVAFAATILFLAHLDRMGRAGGYRA
jgi:UDP-N-acetylmuramyl pentapeptide phosphotransferase/UDP-N-acetylglucosamine-1-phosphate transferase